MNTSLVNTVYDTASSCSVLLCTKQQINRLKTRKITWFSVIGLSSLPYLTFSMISRVDRKHFRSLTTMTVLVFSTLLLRCLSSYFRAFLCGVDSHSGNSCEHRRKQIECTIRAPVPVLSNIKYSGFAMVIFIDILDTIVTNRPNFEQ